MSDAVWAFACFVIVAITAMVCTALVLLYHWRNREAERYQRALERQHKEAMKSLEITGSAYPALTDGRTVTFPEPQTFSDHLILALVKRLTRG